MPRPRKAIVVTEHHPLGGSGIGDRPTPEPQTAERLNSSKARELVGALLIAAILVAVAWTTAKNWHSFVDTLHRVGPGGVTLSLVFGLIGVGATGMQWRTVLGGLGVQFGLRDGAKVFFVSQLGKYVPGSVWPIVMQMEAAHDRGANRKTMIAGNLITLVLGFATGLVLAGLLLPFAFPAALHRFWWALAALPLMIILALPKSLPFLLDLVLALLRRKPLGVQMTTAATLKAAGWATLSWVGLGLHLAILCAAVSSFSAGLVALCIGGMGLAVSAGVLFIPAPAGAGMREVVLGYVLVAVITSGQAVAVVVASRVIIILVDLILAGTSAALGRHTIRPQDRVVAADN
jgi:glycosyltransferase 2 family protein